MLAADIARCPGPPGKPLGICIDCLRRVHYTGLGNEQVQQHKPQRAANGTYECAGQMLVAPSAPEAA